MYETSEAPLRAPIAEYQTLSQQLSTTKELNATPKRHVTYAEHQSQKAHGNHSETHRETKNSEGWRGAKV